MITFATSLDPRLEIRSSNDDFGKYVHRELARELGIPEVIAHGSGMHEAIESIARIKGFTRELAMRTHYGSIYEKKEKIGSSQRYGYRFGEESMWIAEDHVQMYLDYLALKHGSEQLESDDILN